MGIIKDDFLKEEKAKAEAKQKSKYEEALSKYNTDIDDKAVQEAVRKIITEKVPENDTMEVKKFLMGSIELTTLKTTDCDTSVMAFTDRVNAFDEQYPDLPHVATICVYPCFASIVADTLEVEGVEMPKPHDFLSAEQRDGSELQAHEIYTETWNWLNKIGCSSKVSPQLLERYAMCSASWIQCEEMTNKLGFLSKHPTTQKPIPSPFINIGINYMNQAVRLWNEIFQIVKENCSVEWSGPTPQDDVMERLLRARKG